MVKKRRNAAVERDGGVAEDVVVQWKVIDYSPVILATMAWKAMAVAVLPRK